MPHIVIIIEAKKNTVFIPFSWSSWAFLPSKTWTESKTKMLKILILMNKPYNTNMMRIDRWVFMNKILSTSDVFVLLYFKNGLRRALLSNNA